MVSRRAFFGRVFGGVVAAVSAPFMAKALPAFVGADPISPFIDGPWPIVFVSQKKIMARFRITGEALASEGWEGAFMRAHHAETARLLADMQER